MKSTCKSTVLSVLSAILGMAALFHAAIADAGVSCNTATPKRCTWTSPWGSSVGIRLSVGRDQNRVLRWVVSRRSNLSDTRTGTMDENAYWKFFGSEADDIMVEIPVTFDGITHGPHRLTGVLNMSEGIEFAPQDGADIVIGMNFTCRIDATRVENGAVFPSTGTKVFIMHPNSTAEISNCSTRTLGNGGNGTNVLIVGPPATTGATALNRIVISGGVFFFSEWGNDIACNLNSQPVQSMLLGLTDVKFGPTLSGPTQDNPQAGAFCISLWSAVMRLYGVNNVQ